ncbi:uncharacterized protein F4561_004390 [Lipingzhangella halophila]|uniref:DUF177 domain-containing protein n=2 Tax=Lipingzhangella halophila TaxID=1783352 RepID=A0A7W7W5B1_9ACTN|nr:uncharacterized protein [Lipingzhangella halophila]
MRTFTRTVPNPGSFATAMVGVPEGASIELEYRLEAVMEGVLVTGTARTRFAGECSRCLDPVSDFLEAEFQELYRYPEEADRFGGEGSGTGSESDEDEEDYYLEGDLLDLEQVVRDAVVLALPLTPLCRDDCPGLCVECGAKLADVGSDHSHGERVDPRWEALRKLGEEFGDR